MSSLFHPKDTIELLRDIKMSESSPNSVAGTAVIAEKYILQVLTHNKVSEAIEDFIIQHISIDALELPLNANQVPKIAAEKTAVCYETLKKIDSIIKTFEINECFQELPTLNELKKQILDNQHTDEFTKEYVSHLHWCIAKYKL